MSRIRNTAAMYIVHDQAVLRIRDAYPGSEFFPSRIRIKEFEHFNPKKFLRSRKYDPVCSSHIPDPEFFPHPGPRSETLASSFSRQN
jgi:hypothetical protein